MGILAQNVLAPGFISFIDVITTSISEVSRRMFVSRDRTKKCDWLEEYSQGCVMEIYTISLVGKAYKDAVFETVCAAIQRDYGACLFALGIPDDMAIHVVLNPTGYVLKGNEIAYILCQDFKSGLFAFNSISR
jgi:hypothetical protein